MLLKLLRAVIICKMDNAGMGDELQNHFLHALGLREKKRSCIVITPFFGENTLVGTERHEGNNYHQNNTQIDTEIDPDREFLTEGEFFMFPDWERNASTIFNKVQTLNKNVSTIEYLDKSSGVSV
jgi:hypothetical protein